MSYAIANVIYGIPLTEEIHKAIKEEEPEDLGFEVMYSGSAQYTPGFCGVRLCGFDECGDIAVKDLAFEPTREQRAEAEVKIAELPEYIRKVCQPVDTYIVWSTS